MLSFNHTECEKSEAVLALLVLIIYIPLNGGCMLDWTLRAYFYLQFPASGKMETGQSP